MEFDKLIEVINTGVFGGLFAGLGLWAIERLREVNGFKRDEKRILAFFKDHQTLIFWSTHRIASYVNLTEDRVRYVCSTSKHIRRSEGEAESWTRR